MTMKASNFIFFLFILLLTYSSCDKNNDEPDSYQSEVLNDGWPVSNPADQGIDPVVLNDIYNEAKALDNIYSLLVVKNGFLVAEKYFNGQSVYDASSIASVTKSVVSAMTGIAIEKKFISSTEQKLKEFFSEISWDSIDPR